MNTREDTYVSAGKRGISKKPNCRTRIITEGVVPSLHIYHKNTHSKQYNKAQREARDCAPRRPSTNTYDFGIGRRLLPALRQIGFEAMAGFCGPNARTL
jgi:hypothetical protein